MAAGAVTVMAVLGMAGGVLGMAGGEAHTGWSVEGSFVASARHSCGTSVGCTAYILTSAASGQTCNPEFANADGADISIAPLPGGVAGHRARITWTAAAGPVSVLTVGFLGASGAGCADVATYKFDNPNFPPAGTASAVLTISPKARLVYVNGENAFGVTWKLEGIDD